MAALGVGQNRPGWLRLGVIAVGILVQVPLGEVLIHPPVWVGMLLSLLTTALLLNRLSHDPDSDGTKLAVRLHFRAMLAMPILGLSLVLGAPLLGMGVLGVVIIVRVVYPLALLSSGIALMLTLWGRDQESPAPLLRRLFPAMLLLLLVVLFVSAVLMLAPPQ